MKKRWIAALLCLLLTCALAVNLTGCSVEVQAADLMEGIEPHAIGAWDGVVSDGFIDSQMRWSVDLFKASITAGKKGENLLISPLSVQLALAMTANGAEGQTRSEMETLLGGPQTLEELNATLAEYVFRLPSSDKAKLEIANSIWFRDEAGRLTVEREFLETNATWYGAQAYKSAFDDQTINDINNWVKQHTDGMIDRMVEEIDEDTVMYLINALVFDAQWKRIYEKSDVFDGTFTTYGGEKKTVELMASGEGVYLESASAAGFIKDYEGGTYAFAALLPDEGVDVYDYAASLTGEALLDILQTAERQAVSAVIPKFEYEYELDMNDLLISLGMPTAFDENMADFSSMGRSSGGNLYIDAVLHKTFICVDERGTRAGAVTSVAVGDNAAMETKYVRLDRPFVYLILDKETNLPVFMGVVADASA